MSQVGAPPFNPRDAIRRFASELKAWKLTRVTGDAYAGQTFRQDFEAEGIMYMVSEQSKSEIYDAFEPKLNAGEVELLDHPKLTEQLLTLVLRGARIDHLPGDHDDFANAAAGAIWLLDSDCEQPIKINATLLQQVRRESALAHDLRAAGINPVTYRRAQSTYGGGGLFIGRGMRRPNNGAMAAAAHVADDTVNDY